MKRKFTALLLIGLLTMTACTANSNNVTPDVPPEPEHSEPAEIQPLPGELPQVEEPQVQEPVPVEEESANPLEGLIRDQYEGLTVSAAVLPRMAILPGSAIPVDVTVENTGDQTVAYVQGSGSYETPDALVVQSDTLQPVLFRDRVGGVMTMDYVVKELEPGESLQFQVYVMAVEPLEGFRDYTYDLYESDELYIADAQIDSIRERYPEITPVVPGSYTVVASFVYGLVDEAGQDNTLIMAGPTGYAQTELQVSVTD